MVSEILKGLEIPYKEVRFNKTPNTSYAVFTDSKKVYGADKRLFLIKHHVFIELYSYSIDFENEGKLEKKFAEFSIDYDKSERVWLDDEQRYQVIYDFEYVEREERL